MKKTIFIILIFIAVRGTGQDKAALNRVDSTIIAQVIKPAEQEAQMNKTEIDWEGLRKKISEKYSSTEADRSVTKAEIYYYYYRDWPKFSTAIVHYTEAYEDKDDSKLMNKNAQFILQHSDNKDEWKTALTWIQHALEKDPSNETYKTTQDALKKKIEGE